MAKLVGKAYNPVNGATEEIWEGFSWPCLLLDFFWFIYKGMWGWALISLILAVATVGFSWVVFPFFANSLFANYLLKQGYLNEEQWKERQQARTRAASPTSTQNRADTSVADELSKLARLKEQGFLTADEFDRQKSKLLS